MANKPDPEMVALRRIENALAPLSLRAKQRTLRWVFQRVEDEQAAEMKRMIDNPQNPATQLAAVPPPA